MIINLTDVKYSKAWANLVDKINEDRDNKPETKLGSMSNTVFWNEVYKRTRIIDVPDTIDLVKVENDEDALIFILTWG